MILVCEQCGTKYRIKEKSINKKKQKVRCTYCDNTWVFINQGYGSLSQILSSRIFKYSVITLLILSIALYFFMLSPHVVKIFDFIYIALIPQK